MIANNKYLYAVLATLALLIIAALTQIYYVTYTDPFRKVCDLYFSNGVNIERVLLARTELQQNTGLSNRSSAGNGMLFNWESAEKREFWMRDTHIPLSVGFFDKKGYLFRIIDMFPNTDIYHYSMLPALNALEMEVGSFTQFKLNIGVKLEQISCRDI